MNKIRKVKISWVDATSYYNLEEMPNKLPQKETSGFIVRDEDDFIILKDPKTKDYDAHSHRGINVENKDNDPTFLYIPRGMISKIEEIGENKNK